MDGQERRPLVTSIHLPEEWIKIKARYEAWWEGQPLDYPLVRLTAPRAPVPPVSPPSDEAALFDWFSDPLQVLPRLERNLASTFYAGDAFPWLDPMSQGLAAIQAAYHGAPYRIDPLTLTGWTDPLFHDWQSRPSFRIDPANRWWQTTCHLLAEGARRSRGRYIVSIPDLQGGGEILALLRGSQELALDLLDCPEQIAPALQEINLAWHNFYCECFRIIHAEAGAGAGYVDWLGLWSDKPAVTVECDFSVMVSPRMFERYFLPSVEQQVNWVGRAVYHLDGPGAIPHLDVLLSLPGLRAIQWVPTPERPRQVDWIPLLQRIQAADKAVVIACDPDEIPILLQALDPNHLVLTSTCASPQAALELLQAIDHPQGTCPERSEGTRK
jgi:5-methyltetrahydrofolate--homocysteine methyltransferase